jgi:hypothetical protein
MKKKISAMNLANKKVHENESLVMNGELHNKTC